MTHWLFMNKTTPHPLESTFGSPIKGSSARSPDFCRSLRGSYLSPVNGSRRRSVAKLKGAKHVTAEQSLRSKANTRENVLRFTLKFWS